GRGNGASSPGPKREFPNPSEVFSKPKEANPKNREGKSKLFPSANRAFSKGCGDFWRKPVYSFPVHSEGASWPRLDARRILPQGCEPQEAIVGFSPARTMSVDV